MKKPTNTNIISAFRQSNSRAFDLLFDMFFPALCYFATKLIADKQEAEDIVLDTFHKLWDRRQSFETISNIKAFLYISVRNSCMNYLRYRDTQRKRLQQIGENIPNYLVEDAEQQRIRAEVFRYIYSEIEKLPKKCREIFELSCLDGLKPNEIAAQLQITESTVRNQKARAIQLLKAALSDRELLVLLIIIGQVSCINAFR